jgi:hypothetical protein
MVVDAAFDSSTGLPCFAEKDAFYIQDYDGAWLKFAPNTSSLSITRTLNRTSLRAYIHPTDALLVALVFGWPLGFGLWIFYRVVRFAIKG